MQLPSLQEGVILNRYKRFFADVKLPDGQLVVAHVPNTGSMKSCWEPGWKAWLSPAQNPDRKLRWTLELTSPGEGFIMVNTANANKLAGEALTAQTLEPFRGYREVRAEQTILASRFDFQLTGHNELPDAWIEVKNVTLSEVPGIASFPDAVSTRGQKHLKDLMALKRQGFRAAMLYVVARSDAHAFTSALHIDPAYAQSLKAAQQMGVEIYCYRVEYHAPHYRLAQALPVSLP